MKASELIEKLKELHPDTVVVAHSGTSGEWSNIDDVTLRRLWMVSFPYGSNHSYFNERRGTDVKGQELVAVIR